MIELSKKNQYGTFLGIALIWTILILLSLYWNIKSYEEHSIRLATQQAQDYWNKDSAFREWASRHGGMYVKPDTRTPPNPLLAHLPHRDVVTTDGTKLTLMNPAYMMRQMTQEFEELYGVRGKITGQVLLDPQSKTNKADAWELASLKRFDQGITEVTALADIDGATYLRLMRPMFMKPGCVLCHGHLGFTVGDIRGGVSVSVPLEPFEQANAIFRERALITHSIIWLLGISTIIYFFIMRKAQLKQEQDAREAEEKNKKELADSQRHYQSLVETVAAIPWEMNFNTERFSYVGKQAVDVLGFPIEQWLEKDFWIKHIHPDDVAETMRLNKRLALKGDDYFLKYRMIAEDGKIVWIDDFIHVIKKAGQPEFLQGYMFDSTEQVAHEQQLRHSQKMEALGKLTGGIAHDYNNMLGVILGYSEILKLKLSEQPDLVKYIDMIHEAGQRNARLTNKLLTFSREKSLESEVLNINTVLKDINQLLEKTLTARIQLKMELDDELQMVQVDKDELIDTLVNLSINAMYAMKQGGQMTIMTRNIVVDKKMARKRELKPGDYIELTLTDTGTGMDKNILSKLFDPFFSTKGEEGTGLGLSQVYGFVRRFSGDIQVESELGLGSSFTILLPVANQHPLPEDEMVQLEVSNKARHGSETILVVDDERALRELMAEVLSKDGFKILKADNGASALKILQDNPVDLLLTDVIMPDMNGYELAAKVQTLYPEVKLQLISGYSDDSHFDSDESGMHDSLHKEMLHKPCDKDVLLKRIRYLLGSHLKV